MNHRRETGGKVTEMMKEIENLFSSTVGTLTSISRITARGILSYVGREHIEPECENWIKPREIVHEVTTAYSPESSGCAERLNRSILNMTRTMLVHASSYYSRFWAEAVHTACFIRNRLVTKSCKKSVLHLRLYAEEYPIWAFLECLEAKHLLIVRNKTTEKVGF